MYPNSPPTTNSYSIKPYSNPSGPTVYNCGELLPPQTLKFWKDSNLAFAGFCLMICLTDSNELFLVVILVLSYLLVSLNF
jgi:hypothetical protein